MRVVVGLDGSAGSQTVLALIRGLTWPHPSEFVFVTAHEASRRWTSGIPGGGWFDEGIVQSRADLLRDLDAMAEPLRQLGHRVEILAEAGPAGSVLRAAASEWAAELIVVGSRNRGVAASAILGSVSADLADHAPCPVLIARVPRVTRLLIATDGSPSAVAIPEILARWRILRGIPAQVVSVAQRQQSAADFLITAWAPTPSGANPGSGDEIARHHHFVDEMTQRLTEDGWDASGLVRTGDPAREIVASVGELGCDLLITGSRGVSDLQRMVAGSVAHDVLLHSHCSVLVMRGHVPARAAVKGAIEVGIPSFA
jgi:nucleotide-binding universal stress UspA family protein